MNILQRTAFQADGIFGQFTFEGDDQPFMVTLEHAFKQPDGSYLPIIPPGQYQCRRGLHRLRGTGYPFFTYEVLGVKGHSGLLFHAGNFNRDSEGCILTGQAITKIQNNEEMITGSQVTFHRFMAHLGNISSFVLEVRND